MAVDEFDSITRYFYWVKSGQTRILAIGEDGDKTGGDRPREHCIYKMYMHAMPITIKVVSCY